MHLERNAFAAILAGGTGARMGNPERPKQFLMLGSKPVLVHTVEKFAATNAFDAVLVLCPEAWIGQTEDILAKYAPEYADRVSVCAGGTTRNRTVFTALSHLAERYPVNEETVVVTHDAVRPFVSHRIIEENLAAARAHGACDTVIPATDTIVESVDGETISAIPPRNALYQGQTPQSFKLLALKELMESLTPEEELALTDACKVCLLRGRKVAIVAGDPANMKITYPQDMRIARSLIEA